MLTPNLDEMNASTDPVTESGQDLAKASKLPKMEVPKKFEIQEGSKVYIGQIKKETDDSRCFLGNVPQEEVITDDIPSLEMPLPVPVKLVELETGKIIHFDDIASDPTEGFGIDGDVSIKDEIDIEEWQMPQNIPESCDNSAESWPAARRKSKPFVCDICEKSCDTKQHIGQHVRIHCDDRPFKCAECGKSFKQESAKVVHELTHFKKQNGRDERSISKRHVCEICKKECRTQEGLYLHSNVHKNKYLCTFCGKRCGCKANLDTHLRTHTKERPFPCEVCARTFSVKGNLRKHLATHSEERPFRCHACDKTFKTKDRRYKHQLLHLRSRTC